MKDKLELKDIACYLPYELKCKVTDRRKTVIATLGGLYSDGNCVFHDIVESEKGFSKIKPILRPMSDLIKPLPDGTIPIVELAKICGVQEYIKEVEQIGYTPAPRGLSYQLHGETRFQVHFIENKNRYIFQLRLIGCKVDFGFFPALKDGFYYVENQLGAFQYLFENHYDVFGLIYKGLAIDINKIKL